VMIVPIMGHLLPFIGVRPETLMGNLPGYIDAHVTSQVLVGFFTLEVFFSRIHMTFATVFGVVFDFIFTHDVTSCLGVVVWLALKIHPKRVLAMGTGAGYNKGENLSKCNGPAVPPQHRRVVSEPSFKPRGDPLPALQKINIPFVGVDRSDPMG